MQKTLLSQAYQAILSQFFRFLFFSQSYPQNVNNLVNFCG